MIIVATAIGTTGMTRAHAASYATMNVQAGAAARWDPYVLPGTFEGWVTSDGGLSKVQKSWVKCYVDAGWATGNYTSNRWFLAYLNTTNTGRTPLWLYVHSSYVTNQSRVPSCF